MTKKYAEILQKIIPVILSQANKKVGPRFPITMKTNLLTELGIDVERLTQVI